MHHVRLLVWVFAILLVACGQPTSPLYDLDGDGALDADDCAPEDPNIFFGASDPYGDGVDQYCDGADGVDLDGDGFPANVEDVSLRDCNDLRPDVHPGAEDPLGDEHDANCDGHDGLDSDGDGFASDTQEGGNDCDDDDPDLGPNSGC